MAGSGEEVVESCVFCLIANDRDTETKIIKKTKELVCFRDIYPAAPHHYLVIPIQHIVSCHSLHKGHIGLVERMAEFGKAVLRDQGIADMNDIRLGFHQPPYTSVDHLHLHVLAPSSQISEFMGYKFIPKSYRFVTDKLLLKHLKNKDPPVKGFKRKDTTLKTPMETRDASGSEDCPFCQIARSQTDTEILLSDDELLCFRDMKPGATHHYLVVTRTHIDNCKSLKGGDIPLVERMVEMGRTVLKKNKVSNLDDVRFGFHIPPFSSVPHLHLHALAPASTMGFKSQLHYGPQSHWFITVDKVLSQLKIHGKVN